jgi:sugar phosphate isomerase/epimerase
VVSYVRGGFFAHASGEKRKVANDQNRILIEEAATIGAPLLVLVCGADPDQSLDTSRKHIEEGIEQLIPFAKAHNVKLGIEPLHPMYAHSRSAINTLQQANDLSENIDDPIVGVVVDVYHLWWEEDLQNQIMRCGRNKNLFAYHICDWKSPIEDILNDRGIMGEGCIDLPLLGTWISESGFEGYHEVEIFSNRYWSMDQKIFLNKIAEAYRDICLPKQNKFKSSERT